MDPQIQKEIIELKRRLAAIEASATIPKSVDNAFTERLGIRSLSKLQSQTSKTAASETRIVLEGDEVANPMDGFFLFVKDGQSYYIPYYL